MSQETKACPECGETILTVARRCKHCQANLTTPPETRPAERVRHGSDLGVALLAIPVIGSLLTLFWVGNMNLLQGPGSSLQLIVIGTIAITAGAAAFEASTYAARTDRQEGTYSATAWFFILALLWIVGYPAYLFKRRVYGLKNYLVAGIVVTLLFTCSAAMVQWMIQSRIDDIRASLENVAKGVSDASTTAEAEVHETVSQGLAAGADRSAFEATLGLVAVAKTGVAEFRAENDRFPDSCHESTSTDLCDLGPGISLRRAGTVLVDLETVTHDPKLAGQYLKLTPTVEANGDVDWHCSVTSKSPVARPDCGVEPDFKVPEELREVSGGGPTPSERVGAEPAPQETATAELTHALNCHFDSGNHYVCAKAQDAPSESGSNGSIDSGVYAASRNQMLVVKDAIRDSGKALLILGSNGQMTCEEGDVGCVALSGSAERSGSTYQFASESGDCMLSLSPQASRVVIAYTKGSCGLGSANSNLLASIAGTYVLNAEK